MFSWFALTTSSGGFRDMNSPIHGFRWKEHILGLVRLMPHVRAGLHVQQSHHCRLFVWMEMMLTFATNLGLCCGKLKPHWRLMRRVFRKPDPCVACSCMFFFSENVLQQLDYWHSPSWLKVFIGEIIFLQWARIVIAITWRTKIHFG